MSDTGLSRGARVAPSPTPARVPGRVSLPHPRLAGTRLPCELSRFQHPWKNTTGTRGASQHGNLPKVASACDFARSIRQIELGLLPNHPLGRTFLPFCFSTYIARSAWQMSSSRVVGWSGLNSAEPALMANT